MVLSIGLSTADRNAASKTLTVQIRNDICNKKLLKITYRNVTINKRKKGDRKGKTVNTTYSLKIKLEMNTVANSEYLQCRLKKGYETL